MKTLRDRLKIGSNGESWQPTFLKKTALDYDDDDDGDHDDHHDDHHHDDDDENGMKTVVILCIIQSATVEAKIFAQLDIEER